MVALCNHRMSHHRLIPRGARMAAQLKSWFQQAVAVFLDPDRESRVQTLVNVIERGIHMQAQHFSIRTALGDLEYAPQDLNEAKRGSIALHWNAVGVTAI